MLKIVLMDAGAERIAGLDGCKAGWFVVHGERTLANIDWFVAAAFAEALKALGTCTVIGVDIPIGLPDAGSRRCDRQARRVLGAGRSASVFPAPVRAVLGATSYQDACDRHQAVDGRRMSVQAFHILGKMAEVDRVIRTDATARARSHEVHPELAFARLNHGAAIAAPKRSADGFAQRHRLLARRIDAALLDAALATNLRRDVARDDVLDAFAVMLTASRIAGGRAQRVPAEPEYDSCGLDMVIWY